ncbi:flagellar protein FlgN [Rossellomorea vietnamensis]|uniref:Flagellar protein FlgN n=1 Tax=Rossellomorea vietnamensis TaxID=218284 RepID=A0A5D4NNQ6_9BACI|nr:flagellar protein FlgN [Rossellomorea vietnamensis]TYS15171.1 flagellar protein FlgN [Rossellomorea vietnamensis]
MQADQLLTTLEKLYKLHRSLYDLSLEKTNIIKKGETEALNDVMIKEQNYLTAINTLEIKRQQLAAEFLTSKGIRFWEAPSLMDVIERADEPEKARLNQIRQKLLKVTEELKEQNELNQKLVYQSLQFVNMNLSMFQPQPPKGNYSRPNQKKEQSEQTSMFDSKA